jgi:hypothetical protein
MKNIHILPTDKPSILYRNISEELSFTSIEFTQQKNGFNINQNIYITNLEEIKEGVDQWYLDKYLNKPRNSSGAQYGEKQNVIILTTDQDLIKDGVQAIDDEFLEWFVNNPSCEEVEVFKERHHVVEFIDDYPKGFFDYKIIIPQEEPKPIHKFNNGRGATLCGKCYVIISEGLTEDLYCEECKPKQETIEEVAANLADPNICKTDNWIAGAQWQQEQIPSIIEQYLETAFISKEQGYKNPKDWFEQVKKKEHEK